MQNDYTQRPLFCWDAALYATCWCSFHDGAARGFTAKHQHPWTFPLRERRLVAFSRRVSRGGATRQAGPLLMSQGVGFDGPLQGNK